MRSWFRYTPSSTDWYPMDYPLFLMYFLVPIWSSSSLILWLVVFLRCWWTVPPFLISPGGISWILSSIPLIRLFVWTLYSLWVIYVLLGIALFLFIMEFFLLYFTKIPLLEFLQMRFFSSVFVSLFFCWDYNITQFRKCQQVFWLFCNFLIIFSKCCVSESIFTQCSQKIDEST